jgi:hypothetical protein
MRARRDADARVFRSFSEEARANDEYWRSMTPADRLALMWQLALDAWAFTGQSSAESRLPRHIVRVHRAPR